MEQDLIRAQAAGLDIMIKIAVPVAGDHLWYRLTNVTYDQPTGLISGVIAGEPYQVYAEFVMDVVVQDVQ